MNKTVFSDETLKTHAVFNEKQLKGQISLTLLKHNLFNHGLSAMKIIRKIQHKQAHQEEKANLQRVGEQGSGTWSQYGEAAWGQTKVSGLG